MLTTTFPRRRGDGTGNFIFALARALAKNHPLEILTPGFPEALKNENWDGVQIRRFTYFLPRSLQQVIYPKGIMQQLQASVLSRIQLPFFLLAFLLRTIALSKNSDVVLCNWAITAWIGVLARRFFGTPVIAIVRGTDMRLMDSKGRLGGLLLKAVRNSNSVCVVADHLRQRLEAKGVSPVHVIPNGIDFEAFAHGRAAAREKLSLDDGFIVFYAGRLMKEKGVLELLQAARGLPLKLFMAGDGELKPDLAALAKAHGVNLGLLGQVDWQELPLWYASADVVVLPSWSEGRPNVILEAMAAGRACIASDIPGTRELIDDGVSGLLFPARDVEALRGKLRQLQDDPQCRIMLENGARRQIREKVSDWSACAEMYIQACESVTEAQNA